MRKQRAGTMIHHQRGSMMTTVTKNIKQTVLILAGVLAITLPSANGADYIRYVDSTNGLNGNDGLTSVTAWQSLSYAITQIPGIGMITGDTLVIELAAGTYTTDSLETDSNTEHEITQSDVTISGAGIGSTSLIGPGGSTGWTWGLTINADNVNIRDLTLTGFLVGGSGIYISSGTGVSITGCEITGSSYGITVNNSTAIDISPRISDCLINGNESYGVYITSTNTGITSPVIYGNTITNNTTYGVNIWSGGAEVSPDIHANDISGSNTGVYIYSDSSSANPKVTENRIHNNATGIYVSGYNGNAAPIIRNNVIYEPASPDSFYGINMLGGMTGVIGPEIFHNTIDGGGVTQTGIFMSGSAGTCAPTIKYNILSNMAATGIENSSGSAAPVIDYNNMFGNAADYLNCTTDTLDYAYDPVYDSDFSIAVTSQCVDAIPAAVEEAESFPVKTDHIGTSRPRASSSGGSFDYDLGAYEYPYQEVVFDMPGGTAVETDYRIMTLPLTQGASTFTAIFETAFGTYDSTQWRIFTYDNTLPGYVEFSDAAFDTLMTAWQGKAFWLISRTNTTQTIEGELTGNTNPFYVALVQGWNLIALPWPLSSANPAIELQNLGVKDDVDMYRITDAGNTITDPSVWEYGASGYTEQTALTFTLTPGVGYWLYVNSVTAFLIVPPDNDGSYFPMGKKASGVSEKIHRKTTGRTPPPPPGAAPAEEAESGCFMGSVFSDV